MSNHTVVMSGAPEKVRPRAYAIVFTGMLTIMMAFSIRYSYGMLLPEMLPALGITKAQAGTIFALYFVLYTVFSAVLGILSDLYSYRLMLTVFTMLLGVGAGLMGYVSSHAQACLAFSLAGLGHAACWTPITGLVQKWVPDNRRGAALSFVTMGTGIGLIIWGYLLPVIVARADWKAGWKVLGCAAIGVAVANFLLIREPAHAAGSVKGAAGSRFALYWSAFRGLLHSKLFWITAVAYLLLGFIVLVPFTFLSVYAREALGLSYAESTTFVMLLAFTSLIGQVTLGPLSDRTGRVKMIIFCTTVMSLSCLGMAFSRTAWLLYLMTGIFGIGYGSVWLLYAAAGRDFFGRETIGSVLGLWTLLHGVGCILAPIVCGWTIDVTGSYTWAFALAFAVGLLSNLVLLAIPRSPFH